MIDTDKKEVILVCATCYISYECDTYKYWLLTPEEYTGELFEYIDHLYAHSPITTNNIENPFQIRKLESLIKHSDIELDELEGYTIKEVRMIEFEEG